MTPERASATFELPVHGEAGHRCASCESRLCARVEEMPGVLRVECESNGPMRVDFDPSQVSEQELSAETRRYGVELEGVYAHAVWRVTGLDCPDCARTVAKSVSQLKGVVSADLNFASSTLLVEYEAASDPREGRRVQLGPGSHHAFGVVDAQSHPRRCRGLRSRHRARAVCRLGCSVDARDGARELEQRHSRRVAVRGRVRLDAARPASACIA